MKGVEKGGAAVGGSVSAARREEEVLRDRGEEMMGPERGRGVERCVNALAARR